MSTWLQNGPRLAASSTRAEGRHVLLRMRTALFVLLALNVIAVFLLFRSSGQSAESRQRQLAALTTSHDALQARVQQLKSLRGKVLAATQAEQKFAQQNFQPRSTAFSIIIQNLNDLALQSRLRPSEVSYQLNEGDNQLGWVYVEVNLTVEGEYPDLVHFVNQLEQSQLFWILKGMDVSGLLKGSALRLNLKAATYLTPS